MLISGYQMVAVGAQRIPAPPARGPWCPPIDRTDHDTIAEEKHLVSDLSIQSFWHNDHDAKTMSSFVGLGPHHAAELWHVREMPYESAASIAERLFEGVAAWRKLLHQCLDVYWPSLETLHYSYVVPAMYMSVHSLDLNALASAMKHQHRRNQDVSKDAFLC